MDAVRAQYLQTAGYNAFRLGLTSFDAPYKPGTPEPRAWLRGYSDAKMSGAPAMDVSEKSKPKPVIEPARTRVGGAPQQQRRKRKVKLGA